MPIPAWRAQREKARTIADWKEELQSIRTYSQNGIDLWEIMPNTLTEKDRRQAVKLDNSGIPERANWGQSVDNNSCTQYSSLVGAMY